jgi:parallel beta-helix repeat protein
MKNIITTFSVLFAALSLRAQIASNAFGTNYDNLEAAVTSNTTGIIYMYADYSYTTDANLSMANRTGLVISNSRTDGVKPVLSKTAGSVGFLKFENCIDCKVYGLKITCDGQEAFRFSGGNRDIIIENCEIYNSKRGVFLMSSASNIYLRNNYIHDNTSGSSIFDQSGIAFYGNASEFDNIHIISNILENHPNNGFICHYRTATAVTNIHFLSNRVLSNVTGVRFEGMATNMNSCIIANDFLSNGTALMLSNVKMVDVSRNNFSNSSTVNLVDVKNSTFTIGTNYWGGARFFRAQL